MYEKMVVVTRRTRLQELVDRFTTKGQAKFYIEHSGGDFSDYESEDDQYRRALDTLRASLDADQLKVQFLDRSLLSTYLFSARDLVLAVGQDGLVANTAKYAGDQPIIGVNPDPSRFDGILLPFGARGARAAVDAVLAGSARHRQVTLGEAVTNDGQRLLAFNDFFIGARTHVSARYQLGFGGKTEPQSSSGVIVSTGAGSTGWLSSVFNMAAGVARLSGVRVGQPAPMAWEDPRLVFVVREPFLSRHSGAELVSGAISSERPLVIESLMPAGGVLFSDGMESDFLRFDSGSTVTIAPARQKARLVTALA